MNCDWVFKVYIILNAISIVLWFYAWLILLTVVVCRDALTVNTARILNSPLKMRYKLFKRSLRSRFYIGAVFLFFSSMMVLGNRLDSISKNNHKVNFYVISLLISFPIGIICNYRSKGFTTPFSKHNT